MFLECIRLLGRQLSIGLLGLWHLQLVQSFGSTVKEANGSTVATQRIRWRRLSLGRACLFGGDVERHSKFILMHYNCFPFIQLRFSTRRANTRLPLNLVRAKTDLRRIGRSTLPTSHFRAPRPFHWESFLRQIRPVRPLYSTKVPTRHRVNAMAMAEVAACADRHRKHSDLKWIKYNSLQ